VEVPLLDVSDEDALRVPWITLLRQSRNDLPCSVTVDSQSLLLSGKCTMNGLQPGLAFHFRARVEGFQTGNQPTIGHPDANMAVCDEPLRESIAERPLADSVGESFDRSTLEQCLNYGPIVAVVHHTSEVRGMKPNNSKNVHLASCCLHKNRANEVACIVVQRFEFSCLQKLGRVKRLGQHERQCRECLLLFWA
jgi:hypothetical protein